MRKFLFSAMAFLAINVVAKDIKTAVLTPQPAMSCMNCENKVKTQLKFEKGVKKIETNLQKQTITVQYDADKTDVEKLQKSLSKVGYSCTLHKSEVSSDKKEKAKN